MMDTQFQTCQLQQLFILRNINFSTGLDHQMEDKKSQVVP